MVNEEVQVRSGMGMRLIEQTYQGIPKCHGGLYDTVDFKYYFCIIWLGSPKMEQELSVYGLRYE